MDSGLLPANMAESYLRATDTLLERVERVFDEVGPTRQIRLHGTAIWATCCGMSTGPCSSTSMTA